jgi:putative transposase
MEELKPEAFFVKFTTINNLDIFVRKHFKEIVVDTLLDLQSEYPVDILGFIIMPDHISIIANSEETKTVETFCLRFKKSVSQKVMDALSTEEHSDKRWLLFLINFINKDASDGGINLIWNLDCQLKPLYNRSQVISKLDFIHFTPVLEGFVSKPEEYIYSSAQQDLHQRRKALQREPQLVQKNA